MLIIIQLSHLIALISVHRKIHLFLRLYGGIYLVVIE